MTQYPQTAIPDRIREMTHWPILTSFSDREELRLVNLPLSYVFQEAEKRPVMARTANLVFSHLRNDNGTVNSICLKCFSTIATKGTEADLADSEAAHECSGFNQGYSLRPEGKRPGSI
jgi:hypothetical protein